MMMPTLIDFEEIDHPAFIPHPLHVSTFLLCHLSFLFGFLAVFVCVLYEYQVARHAVERQLMQMTAEKTALEAQLALLP